MENLYQVLGSTPIGSTRLVFFRKPCVKGIKKDLFDVLTRLKAHHHIFISKHLSRLVISIWTVNYESALLLLLFFKVAGVGGNSVRNYAITSNLANKRKLRGSYSFLQQEGRSKISK